MMFSLFQWDYSPLTKTQVQQIIAKSVNHGSCIRCALSMVQCFQSQLYSCPSQRIINILKEGELISEEFAAKYGSEGGGGSGGGDEQTKDACVVCKGLFQDDHLFREIPAHILKETTDVNKFTHFDSFGLSINLHHEFLVRDHLMTVFARDGIYEFKNEKEGSNVIINADRKRILREVLVYILTNELNGYFRKQQEPRTITHKKHNYDIFVEIKAYENELVPEEDQQEEINTTLPSRKRRKENRVLAKQKDTLGSIVKEFNLEKLRTKYTCPPVHDQDQSASLKLQIEVTHSPIYFSGKYLKLLRGLPQSPWVIIGNPAENKDGSLEEYIGRELLKACRAESWKFDSAGREDIDVRMLGSGRPFVFTMLKPVVTRFTQTQLKELETSINDKYKDIIQVNSLKVAQDNAVSKQMHEGAVEKRKRYRCVIWYSGIIEDDRIRYMESLKDLKIKQGTPVRVLHRRAAQVREKIIHELKCVEKVNDHYMILDLTTSAGTYVKEFVHSDFGRTVPSLGTLLASNKTGVDVFQDAHILQLDVMDIEMEM